MCACLPDPAATSLNPRYSANDLRAFRPYFDLSTADRIRSR